MIVRGKLALVLFGLLCVAQWTAPARMLWVRETVLRDGVLTRFRCAPLDPADPLRGRYVALRFEADEAPVPGFEVRRGDRIAVPVVTDDDGFARLGAPRTDPPDRGPWMWVEATDGHAPGDPAPPSGTLDVRLPFDRFYMDENRAPEAERAIARRGADTVETWLVVRVRDGRAVPEELFLDGLPVREFLDRRGSGGNAARSPD